MIIKLRLIVFIITAGLFVSGCNNTSMVREEEAGPDTLEIYSDGNMVFNNRLLPVDDVIIYPDGYGGEKAAVKIYVPLGLHPPFFRNSIVVDRKESNYKPETQID